MPTIEELTRYKLKNPKSLDNQMKDLNISKVFVARCLNINIQTFYNLTNSKEGLPDDILDRVIEILIAVSHLRNGEKLLPIRNTNSHVLDTEQIKDKLMDIAFPTISPLGNRVEELEVLIEKSSKISMEVIDSIEHYEAFKLNKKRKNEKKND